MIGDVIGELFGGLAEILLQGLVSWRFLVSALLAGAVGYGVSVLVGGTGYELIAGLVSGFATFVLVFRSLK